MAKRNADKELTDRNWDQEDEGEEAGTFSVASHDVLKNRAIKKAKRRNTGGEPENPGAFKSFKGFSLTQPAASGGPTTGFSGFGNGAGFKGLAGLTNGNGSAPSFGGFSVAATTPGLMFNGPASTKPSADVGSKQSNGSVPSSSQSSGACSGGSVGSNKEYSRQLTALNCSVRDWITKHVNDNPLCDLNPIFKDYEQHLASIERKYGAAQPAHGASESNSSGEKQGDANPPLSSSSSCSSSSSSSAALFSFGRDKEGSGQDKSGGSVLPVGGTFNFGQKVDSSALGSSPPCFSFSSKPSSSSSGQSSLFGASAAPFSFSGAKAEASQHTDENGDEESEEPPKPEVREIKEKDAFYSKKCKLFYKKELEFKEKGVGTLHLKTTAESKTQMIIRADTNLGNILLNVIAQPSMPCSRVGKNNVVVVCVPNPPVDDKNPSGPVPLLIRVKTAEDADELHNILEEKKV